MMLPPDQLNLALLQLTSTNSIDENLRTIELMLKGLKGPLDLVLLPENCLFMRMSRQEQIPFMEITDPCFAALSEIAKFGGFEIWLGSVPLREGEKYFNASVRLRPGLAPKVSYRKIHLFDVDVTGHAPQRESEEFDPGIEPVIEELRSWRIGMSICYDLRFSELYLHYAKAAVDAVVVPSAFLVPTGRDHWEPLIRARAIEGQFYILAAAQGGVHKGKAGGQRETWGHSFAIDPWGRILGEGSDSNRILRLTIDKKIITSVRNQIPMAQHRRL